ncbi:hypothetical protein HHI36_020944 [Cryptolaemus montrouzieri]|uniref:Uncharacterized protein n=1 Tax=Cryptolaemus montrouzieri TaxID=559131 RepID=A0ABD2NBV8_9CUCU
MIFANWKKQSEKSKPLFSMNPESYITFKTSNFKNFSVLFRECCLQKCFNSKYSKDDHFFIPNTYLEIGTQLFENICFYLLNDSYLKKWAKSSDLKQPVHLALRLKPIG